MSDEKRELVRSESGTPTVSEPRARTLAPRYELTESETSYTLTLEMPGVNKETLELQAERDTLTVRGKRVESVEGFKPIFRERPSAEYFREFSMDDTVDHEKITASIRDGIVNVQIPKSSHAKPRRVQVS